MQLLLALSGVVSKIPIPHPTPTPPAGTHCAARTNSLDVSWSGGARDSNTLYEVQVGLDGHPTFMTLTSETPAVTVEDLWPNTTYSVALRKRACYFGIRLTCEWSELSEPTGCATSSLARHQLHILPPKFRAPLFSIIINFAVALLEGVTVELQLRPRGSSSWGQPYTIHNISNATIGHLRPGTAYEVRASSSLAPSLWSDPVVHRTHDADVETLDLFRIAEGCGEHCVAPDYLYNHDAGDVASDIWFITNMAKPSPVSQALSIAFNDSYIAKYCVHREAVPFADYVSCNGQPESQICTCAVYMDRCIGRRDVSSCNEKWWQRIIPDVLRPCECDADASAYSASHIGRQDVYLPMPAWTNDTAKQIADIDCMGASPANESTFAGHWYSLPRAAECPIGTLPDGKNGKAAGKLVEAAEGAVKLGSGCTWSRRQWQHFIRGKDLIAAGLNTSDAMRMDAAQLKQNEEAMVQAFALHEGRCCGC